jgi:hypothetical protein
MCGGIRFLSKERFSVLMHVHCRFQLFFFHPSMAAVLVIQHNRWAVIEPEFIRQDDVARSIARQSVTSKYPPAEPGALVLEPLKAAYPCCFNSACPPPPRNASTSFVETIRLTSLLGRQRLHNIYHDLVRRLSNHSSRRFSPYAWAARQAAAMERGRRPPDMSNFCCLPGRAGGTPMLV